MGGKHKKDFYRKWVEDEVRLHFFNGLSGGIGAVLGRLNSYAVFYLCEVFGETDVRITLNSVSGAGFGGWCNIEYMIPMDSEFAAYLLR